MKIYLVEDCYNSPGRIYAVFASQEDATMFSEELDIPTAVNERTLWYGQPPTRGYNE